MDNKLFDLEKFGIGQYTLSQVIYDKTIISMKYENLIKHIEIEGNTLRLVIKEDGYVKKISKKSGYDKTLRELVNDYSPPIIQGYYDAQTRDMYTYSLEFNVAGKNVVLEFDCNTVTVYTPSNGVVLVFKTDDNNIMKSGELLESYHLLEDGFVYTNYIDQVSTLFYNGFRDNIRFYFDIRNKMGSSLLDYLPVKIVHISSTFVFKYDEDGMVKECDMEPYDKMEYCKYYKEENITTSIHPLIFDPFTVLYDNNPLEYWSKDTLETLDDGTREFRREVFKVVNVYDLLNNLNLDLKTT